MKKLLSIVVLVCIVMSMCTVSAWAEKCPYLPEAVITDITSQVDFLTFARQFKAIEPDSIYDGSIYEPPLSTNTPIDLGQIREYIEKRDGHNEVSVPFV